MAGGSANGEVVTLSRGVSWGTIDFEERPDTGYRAYHLTTDDGRVRVPSVTTVLGKVLPKESLLRWYEACGAEGAVLVGRQGLLRGVEAADAIDVVRDQKAGASAASGRAKDRGKGVHGILERWMEAGEGPNPADYPPEWRGFITGLARWLMDAEPQAVATEQLVAHPEFMYAGRYDLRAFVDGIDTILDLKTRNRAQVYFDDLMQVAGYDLAAQQCGDPPATQCMVVVVGPDGSYDQQLMPSGTREVWKLGMDYFNLCAPLKSAWEAKRRQERKAAA